MPSDSDIQYVAIPASLLSDISTNLKCLQKGIGMCIEVLKDCETIKEMETGSATSPMNELQNILNDWNSTVSDESSLTASASGSSVRFENSPNLSKEDMNGEVSGNVAVARRKSKRTRKQVRRSCEGIILPKKYNIKNHNSYELLITDGNRKNVISNLADFTKYFGNGTSNATRATFPELVDKLGIKQ